MEQVPEAIEIVRPLTEWLLLIGLGSIAGMLGQGARTVVGLKKVNDKAEAEGHKEFSDLFSATRLVISLLIGAVAGSFAALATVAGIDKVSTTQVLGLMAAGYAGTDFIEGFMNRMLPQTGDKQTTKTNTANTNPDPVPPPQGEEAAG